MDILFDETMNFGKKVSAIQCMKCNGNLTASTILQTEKPEGTTEHRRDPVESCRAVIFQKQYGVEKVKLTYSMKNALTVWMGWRK